MRGRKESTEWKHKNVLRLQKTRDIRTAGFHIIPRIENR